MKLFLDCDQTLYRNASLVDHIRSRMVLFMQEHFGEEAEVVNRIRAEYLKKYGTTLAGLMIHEGIDPGKFINFVHDVDLTSYLSPNPALRTVLESLVCPVYIASNAPGFHVERVLGILGIDHIPLRIFSIESFGYEGKPNRSSYEYLLEQTSTVPGEAMLIDDYSLNLKVAREMGFATCLVGDEEWEPRLERLEMISSLPGITH
ncbi:MAG: HAD hydrolase-like protein [Caldisericales bacterium]|nr:HAD hydrolase-like protein [Caldisericales bacterium]